MLLVLKAETEKVVLIILRMAKSELVHYIIHSIPVQVHLFGRPAK